jgi:DNA-binding NarL/FixJ family response regulator
MRNSISPLHHSPGESRAPRTVVTARPQTNTTLAAGDALLAPSVTRRLIADFASRPRPDPPVPGTLDALTNREAEVLRLIARGLSNAEISDTLVIAEQTTKTHAGRILGKLGLRDRAQAVVLAYETGLVTPGGYSTDE